MIAEVAYSPIDVDDSHLSYQMSETRLIWAVPDPSVLVVVPLCETKRCDFEYFPFKIQQTTTTAKEE